MLHGDIWPRNDYSRVPYFLYHDQSVYESERELVFRGPVWLYLGLDAEIPAIGDFRTSFLGDVPVVFNRAKDGRVHAMVNRCAHRGAMVRREAHGNALNHTCIYHRWNYDLEGTLIGIPFRKGVAGKGGMDPEFDMTCHSLRKLTVQNYHGILFASFSEAPEPIEDYLGPYMAWHLRRLMSRPVRILGYQRQRIHGNWKLYCENLRDQYHGSLLHQFHRKFGISRVTQQGGAQLDPRHRHSISYTQEGTDSSEAALKEYRDQGVKESELRLRDGSMLRYTPDFGDEISLAICSVFPNACFQQIRNSLATRQIRPRGVDDFELFWTIFGYEDDTPEMQNDRMIQTNMIGPAGMVSMEDGEAVEIAHRSTNTDQAAHAVIEMGGGGAIPTHVEFKASDIPVRGFWSYYAELMGCEAEGGDPVIPVELRLRIADMLNDYAHVLDDDRLEAWPEFFLEDGVYRIIPRENRKQNLPGVIIVCFGRNMMYDRIKVLREANEFNIHTDRHVIGSSVLTKVDRGFKAITSYSLFQTDQEGETRLFSVGCYEDLIELDGDQPRFRDRTVVVDTYAIPNLLATPI